MIDQCEVERDGKRCMWSANHDGPHECEAAPYAEGKRVAARTSPPAPSIEARLQMLEGLARAQHAELDVLRAQVRSLQEAMPSGIGHAGKAQVR